MEALAAAVAPIARWALTRLHRDTDIRRREIGADCRARGPCCNSLVSANVSEGGTSARPFVRRLKIKGRSAPPLVSVSLHSPARAPPRLLAAGLARRVGR